MKKLFVLLAALVVLFSFCAVSAEDLNIAYMPNYASLWSVVTGVNMGYFEEEGLNVHLVEFADGPTIIAAMESGSIDMGYIGPGAHKLCIQGRAKIFMLSQIGNADHVLARHRQVNVTVMGTTEDVEDRKWNNGEVIDTRHKFTDEEKAYD